MTTAALPERALERDPMRVLTITANLLPIEVTDARRAHKMRWIVALLLAVVVAGLVFWDLRERAATSDAEASLKKTQAQVTELQRSRGQYTELSTTKNSAAALQSKLTQLMGQDVAWYQLVPSIRTSAATAGVTVTNVNASLSTASAAASTQTSVAGTTVTDVGTIAVIGTSSDKTKVAAYLDLLAKVPGLGAPKLSGITVQGTEYQFTLSVPFTSALYQGRYSATTPGGK